MEYDPKIMKNPQQKVDPQKLKELNAKGKTCREIAESLDVSMSTIRDWKRKLGLVSNLKRNGWEYNQTFIKQIKKATVVDWKKYDVKYWSELLLFMENNLRGYLNSQIQNLAMIQTNIDIISKFRKILKKQLATEKHRIAMENNRIRSARQEAYSVTMLTDGYVTSQLRRQYELIHPSKKDIELKRKVMLLNRLTKLIRTEDKK